MPESRSALVIGSGAAGSAAARGLADGGFDVTVIERDKVGGTCLWRGCMPKKSLFASARTMRTVRGAEQYGVAGAEGSIDWPGVLAWKWHAQETYAGDQESLLAERGIALVKGDARFTGPNTVETQHGPLTADAIVLATGSQPFVPDVPGFEHADTSLDALRYPSLPDSLLIVGGGFIALEFAGIFAALGTRITVLTRSAHVLSGSDPDIAEVVVKRLRHQGVEFLVATVERLEGAGDSVRTVHMCDSEGTCIARDYTRVLLATGRRPALDGLDLAAAGINTDGRGTIVLDRFLRTSNPAIWTAGDVADRGMHTPLASHMGRTVAASIVSGTPTDPGAATVPVSVFTDPEIGQVGLTPEEAVVAGLQFEESVTRYEFLGTAVIDDERDGMVKLLFDSSDSRLLGAHIVGPHAGDLAYAMAVGIAHGATRDSLRQTLGIHPAYCEALNWAAF